jgi:hypothetical protein
VPAFSRRRRLAPTGRYPQAHEDDAERAVRAGLELIQAVGGLKSGVPLQTRVGIATGLVVVGDLIGSGTDKIRRRVVSGTQGTIGLLENESGRACRRTQASA